MEKLFGEWDFRTTCCGALPIAYYLCVIPKLLLFSSAMRDLCLACPSELLYYCTQKPRSLASLGMTNVEEPPAAPLLAGALAGRLSYARVAGQLGGFVGGFPGEVGIVASEVTIGCRLFINGTTQVQGVDNAARS